MRWALMIMIFTAMADGVALMRRGLAIREKSLGSNSIEVAESLDHLGALMRATGRVDDALASSRRSAEIVVGILRTD
jgi:hypothetical protein